MNYIVMTNKMKLFISAENENDAKTKATEYLEDDEQITEIRESKPYIIEL